VSRDIFVRCQLYHAVNRIGAGTGIFTRALLAHPEWASSVRGLKAIEPSQGMREVFTEAVRDHRVATFEGTFDKTGVEDGWADLVVVAQVSASVFTAIWEMTEIHSCSGLMLGAGVPLVPGLRRCFCRVCENSEAKWSSSFHMEFGGQVCEHAVIRFQNLKLRSQTKSPLGRSAPRSYRKARSRDASVPTQLLAQSIRDANVPKTLPGADRGGVVVHTSSNPRRCVGQSVEQELHCRAHRRGENQHQARRTDYIGQGRRPSMD
jgi:hypothetical protein